MVAQGHLQEERKERSHQWLPAVCPLASTLSLAAATEWRFSSKSTLCP